MSASFAFPKTHRILHSSDFKRIKDSGTSVRSRLVVLVTTPSKEPHSRLGIVVTKKIGNAVVRNTWKRVIREFFRFQTFQAAVDHVIIIRHAAGGLSLNEIKSVGPKELSFIWGRGNP